MDGQIISLMQKKESRQIASSSNASSRLPLIDSESGLWKSLKEVFPWNCSPYFSFSNAEIINYFVSKTAVDGLPAIVT